MSAIVFQHEHEDFFHALRARGEGLRCPAIGTNVVPGLNSVRPGPSRISCDRRSRSRWLSCSPT